VNASQLLKFEEIHQEENQTKVEELLLWEVLLIPGGSENGFLKDFS